MLSRSIGQIALLILIVLALPLSGQAANKYEVRTVPPGRTIEDLQNDILTSSTTGDASKAPQRFYLYGAPGSNEGTFEDALGGPDWQDWTSVDNTQILNHWHVSDFNAANLHGNGGGNLAMWCGDNPTFGWVDPPGYGNNWNDALVWRSGPLGDPSAGQTVQLDFFFNHDTEPGYDYLMVEYQAGNDWNTTYSVSGTNHTVDDQFLAPGLQYFALTTSPITYAGNDYGGTNNDEIVLRFRLVSDGGFSDEDGLWPTIAGAAQVDDVTVTYQDGGAVVDFADFEGGGPYSWVPSDDPPFVGDFTKIFVGLTDIDECRENQSPQVTFIDDGSSPNNAPGQTTGGSTSPLWSYGTSGGWTTNDSGGLAGAGYYQNNTAWSPIFERDLPGPEDDGPHFKWTLEFEAFEHHTLYQPMVFPSLRRSSNGLRFLEFEPSVTLFFAPAPPRYYDRSFDITDLIRDSTIQLQAGVRYEDLSYLLGLPYDATPAPFVDNVRVYKEVSGPRISVSRFDLFHDAFPPSGSLDVSTQAARDALDVVVDASNSNSFGDFGAMIVTAESVTFPLTSANDIAVQWVLDKNPLFEDDIRTMPTGSTVAVGTGPNGWDQVNGTAAATPIGLAGNEQFWFDLPDEDFFYPGDRLRFFIYAQLPNGPLSTLPMDIAGFSSGVDYDPMFTVRALPSIVDAQGTQPEVLLVDYNQNGNNVELFELALGQIGLKFDEHVDVMLAKGSGPHLADPIQGATPAQLGGYSCVIVSARFWPDLVDYDVLELWHDEPGDKLAIHFGDDVVTSAPVGYRADVMGAQLVQSSVLTLIGEKAPIVVPLEPGFLTGYVANATCYGRGFDAILPEPGAVTAHGYDDGLGGTLASASASVLHARTDGDGDVLIDVTLPYGFETIEDEHAKILGASARSELLAELLGLMGHVGDPPTTLPVPRVTGIFDLGSAPNPFNPNTEIRFLFHQEQWTTVKIFDLRGRHVVDLHDGWLGTGPHRLPWSGVDAHGRSVASGVYLVQVKTPGHEQRLKVALVE